MRRFSTSSLALTIVLALFVLSVGPVLARGEGPELSVYHGPVDISLVNADSDGHQVGDLRVTTVPTTSQDGVIIGRLDATLTTTGIDTPALGDEIRISTLVFDFDDELDSQIVVSGSAEYPADGPTIATGDTTVRPIVGGSGRFAGASGSAATTHLEDGDWIHAFTFDNGKAARAFLKKPKKDKAGKWDRDADRKDAIDAGLGKTPDANVTEEVNITRTDLGVAQPATAQGQELGLWHYLIPAGAELAPHTHAGWQIARIAEGELEYTIVAGEGTRIAADGSSQQVGPGTYVLKSGDSIVENPDLEHFGANRTDKPVTIVAATLYAQGAPLSLPLELDAADEPEGSLAPAA